MTFGKLIHNDKMICVYFVRTVHDWGFRNLLPERREV